MKSTRFSDIPSIAFMFSDSCFWQPVEYDH